MVEQGIKGCRKRDAVLEKLTFHVKCVRSKSTKRPSRQIDHASLSSFLLPAPHLSSSRRVAIYFWIRLCNVERYSNMYLAISLIGCHMYWREQKLFVANLGI